MNRMAVCNRKGKNVNNKSLIPLIFLFHILFIISGKVYGQEANSDYHLLLNEIVNDTYDNTKIRILDQVLQDFEWLENFQDSMFIENCFKYKCDMEKLRTALNNIDFDLLKHKTIKCNLNKWNKNKLKKSFKIYTKPTKKKLTYQYSVPLVQKNTAFIRIKSFQHNEELSDYVFILEKTNERWEDICTIVISETFF